MQLSSRTTMKITTCVLVAALTASAGLGFYLNYNTINNKSEKKEDNIKSNSNFFLKDNKDNIKGINFKIKDLLDKESINLELTNFESVYNVFDLEFDDIKIRNNLIRIIKNALKKTNFSNNLEDYYFKIRYTVNKKKLYIDARWGLLNKILNNKKMKFYYDNFVVTIIN